MLRITDRKEPSLAHRQGLLSVKTSNTTKVATLGTLILLAGTALCLGRKYLRARSPKIPPAPRTSPILPKDELKFPLQKKDTTDAAFHPCNAETPKNEDVTEGKFVEVVGNAETPRTNAETPKNEDVTEGKFVVVGNAETPRTNAETPKNEDVTEGKFVVVGNAETPRAGGAAPAAAAAATEQAARTEQQPKTPPSGGRRYRKKH